MIKFNPQKSVLDKSPFWSLQPRLNSEEQILFAKRLAVLISANVPILQALRMIQRQTTGKSSLVILKKIILEVENGQFLSSAMSQFGSVFGDFAVSIIRIGEISGRLPENLHYLAEELKKKRELVKKIVSALIYPSLIVVATLGISGLLTVYVLPKILPIFKSFKSQLPMSTRILIFISNAVFRYWPFILAGMSLAAAGVWALTRLQSVRQFFDRAILRLPLLGPMFQSYILSNFCRTLGLLLKSDVHLEEAVKITAESLTNSAYQQELRQIFQAVIKGENLSTQMNEKSEFFPAMLWQMVAVGETAGNLSDSLIYLAALYEENLSDMTKNLATAIEPALMIFLGLIVGFVAISIITPIYGITQNLHP